MKRVLLKLIMVACFSAGLAVLLPALLLFFTRGKSESVGISLDEFVFGLILVVPVVIDSVLGTSAIVLPVIKVKTLVS